MDFSQFLVNNSETKSEPNNAPKIINPKSTTPKEQKEPKENKPRKEKKTKDKIINLKPDLSFQEKEEPQRNFKKGDFVIIQRMEGSPLNVYKGYFGEIKEYKYNNDIAYIILEAMNNPRRIQFPLGHFVHRTKFN